jgi:hypothetical protein
MDFETALRGPCRWRIGTVDVFDGEFGKLDNPFRGVEFKLEISVVTDSPC